MTPPTSGQSPVSTSRSTNPIHALPASLGVAGHTDPVSIPQTLDGPYEVPVHADIPYQEVVFLEEADPISSPMKAKGVGELGICGVGAALANAIYNATGVRVRDYPITLDKLIGQLPAVA